VDSAISNRTSAAPARAAAVPDAGVSEIGMLIFDEHARILRLFGALDGLIRRGEPAITRLALDQIWTRLASLVDVHTRAEEEVVFPLVFGSGPRALDFVAAATADHDDLREAVAEARLLDVDSSRWWRVVTAARAACAQHFASEERGLLAQVCGSLPPETSKDLVRRWTVFAAVHASDAR
jgi:Hemerythrin HHE cation binding domain